MEQSPQDIWAIHSMAHVKEESLKSREGLQLLKDKEPNWSNNGSLNTHVWWHVALFHFQLGEYEQALTLYDDTIKPMAVSCKLYTIFVAQKKLFSKHLFCWILQQKCPSHYLMPHPYSCALRCLANQLGHRTKTAGVNLEMSAWIYAALSITCSTTFMPW